MFAGYRGKMDHHASILENTVREVLTDSYSRAELKAMSNDQLAEVRRREGILKKMDQLTGHARKKEAAKGAEVEKGAIGDPKWGCC